MHPFHVVGILTSLAALFAYLNHRFIRLPTVVGLMLQSLLLSVVLILLFYAGVDLIGPARSFVEGIDFNALLLEGLLSFLLFAGALFFDINDLMEVKVDVAVLSIAGVLLSTVLVAIPVYFVGEKIGIHIRFIYSLLFGALISPTDPIGVVAMLRKVGVPKQLNARIGGEALFNDGIGIVLFITILSIVTGKSRVGGGEVALLFVRETFGGLLFGLALGWAGYFLLKSIDNYQVEILLTLALVTGGYSVATVVGISGPLAMVIAGLLIGDRGRRFAMSRKTRENLDRFWELVEEMLNAILFTLIGLEVLTLLDKFTVRHLAAGLIAIPIVLIARFVTVGVLGSLLRLENLFPSQAIRIVTWSGLRGGISIALALSLPMSPERDVIVLTTYIVAAFSILVQGPTVTYLARE